LIRSTQGFMTVTDSAFPCVLDPCHRAVIALLTMCFIDWLYA
jgi:hypothetical protein